MGQQRYQVEDWGKPAPREWPGRWAVVNVTKRIPERLAFCHDKQDAEKIVAALNAEQLRLTIEERDAALAEAERWKDNAELLRRALAACRV